MKLKEHRVPQRINVWNHHECLPTFPMWEQILMPTRSKKWLAPESDKSKAAVEMGNLGTEDVKLCTDERTQHNHKNQIILLNIYYFKKGRKKITV